MELIIIFAFAAMILWGISDFFMQKTVRKIGNIQMLAYLGIIGSIVFLPFLIKDISTILNWQSMVLLVSIGLLSALHSLTAFEAFNKGKLSVVEVIIQIELPITIVLSVIFFKELLSTYQIILIAAILIGIIFVSTGSFKDWKSKIEQGALLALVSGALFGIDNFLTATGSKNISPIMALALPWIVLMIISLIVLYKKEGFSNLVSNGIKNKWIIFWAMATNIGGWLSYVFAVEKSYVSIISAITGSYTIVALLLGLIINKEKIVWHQYLGAAIVLSSCILISLTL